MAVFGPAMGYFVGGIMLATYVDFYRVNMSRYFVLVYTKPTECVDPPYIIRFSQLVPWNHESIGRVISGHQLGKPSDVLQTIEELRDMRYVIWTAISHGHIK